MLTKRVINRIKTETKQRIPKLLHEDVVKIILYGSCTRGDYDMYSDVDIAIIMGCSRKQVKKYREVSQF